MRTGLLLFPFLLTACGPRRPAPVVSPLPVLDSDDAAYESDVGLQKLKTVRIGIRERASKASLRCAGPLTVVRLDSNRSEEWPPGFYLITVAGGQISVKGKRLGRKVRFRSVSRAHPLLSNQKKYRGSFLALVSKSTKFNLIDELSVDDYLKGVLPREVIVSWPLESLKAQAVASRTYLASHMGRHRKEGFDLCATIHCQVYGGMEGEDPRTNKAVNETAGQILVHGGKPIGAFFHSNCGGQTEQILPVWGTPNRPYLPSVKCPYGTEDPHYEWLREFTRSEMIDLLRKQTPVSGSVLKSFRIKSKSESGRAAVVEVETDRGRYPLSGNAFRMALNPGRMRSTLWTDVRKTRTGYLFKGRGWGHGVGMCQWGAKGLAELGRTYKQILRFYYPNTAIHVWTD